MSLSSEPKLPAYQYAALKTPEALRLLRLIPARENQSDIDCEIIEVPLSEDHDDNGDLSGVPEDEEKGAQGLDERSELYGENGDDSSDDEHRSTSSTQAKEQNRTIHSDQGIKIRKKRQSYEAVSWCWGREPADQILRVHNEGNVSAFLISQNLKSALWALRKSNEVRQLWIDAICINQKDTKERNEQVPRMDRIYGKAANVCIWLGAGDADSKLAMDFIKNKVLQLWEFDELIENRNMAKHWASLIRLMKRPWFSRRWVVQEIALSPRGGTIHCGKDYNTWQDFADAVSLFVEVETATHRLSDVMKLDQSFGNIPEFFGDVSSLGAALLVHATSNLFRNAKTGQRKPLSSLEYLVSRLSVFEATQPRDTIYALLAISRDTTPKNLEADSDSLERKEQNALALAPAKGFLKQDYNVDYTLPVIDVYQEFLEFSIKKSDPTRALDIICRPWAPTVMESHDDPDFLKTPSETNRTKRSKRKDREIPLPSWIPSMSGAAFEMEEHPTAGLRMERQNADPLVGMPEESGHRNYSAAGDTKLDKKSLKFMKWESLKKPNARYPEYSMFVRGFILDEVSTVDHLASNGNIPYRWLKAGDWTDTEKYPPENFWRTLVADRGHGGRNPPTYFPRACKESMRFKAKTMSKTGGNLDSKKLINEGHCTIVAEFLRRVQEVIWNRQLMKTAKGRLGLVRDDVRPGFEICILYGCSVPVILQRVEKSADELKAEQQDRYKQWKKELKRVVAFCQARYLMNVLRRERKEKQARLARMPSFQVNLPASAEQNLRWLTRKRSGTLPLNKDELSQAAHLPPLETRHSFLDVSEGIHSTINEPSASSALSDQASTMDIHLPSSGESLLHENGSQPTDRESYNDSAEDPGWVAGSVQGSHHNVPPVMTHEDDEPPAIVRRKTEQEKQLEREEHAKGEREYKDRKIWAKNRPVPTLEYYRLIGECYVHGMMNGEAIGLQTAEEIPSMIFELR